MDFLHLCAIYLQLLTTLLIVFSRNPIHFILLLIVLLFEMTFVLILFNVEFTSLLLCVFYVGAIAVLFLFVITMLQGKSEFFNSFYIILISFILSLSFPKRVTLASKVYCSKKQFSKKFNNSILITKRGLCTFKPHVLLPKKVRNVLEDFKTQIGIMVVYLVTVYWYFWGFKLILPIILVNAFFFLLVVLHFNFVKTSKKTSPKISWYGGLFLVFCYLIFCFITALYFDFWTRRIFLLFSFILLVWILLPPTSEIKQKLLPGFIANFLETYRKDTLIIQNHLVFDLPFVYSTRMSFYLYSVLLYILHIIVLCYPVFLGLISEHIAFLIWSNLLTLMYLLIYELYIIWCCNAPTELNILFSFKTAVIGAMAFIGGQFMLNSLL